MEPRKDWCCDWQSGGYESEQKVWGTVTKPSKISKPPISPNLRVFFGKLPLFAVLVGPPLPDKYMIIKVKILRRVMAVRVPAFIPKPGVD